MEMFTVKRKEEVHDILCEAFDGVTLDQEVVSLEKIVGRTLAEDVVSNENIPSFRRSTVDGYGVRSVDIVGCSESMPAFLKVTGETIMGQGTELQVAEEEAIYVPTGGIVPEGADTMVMIEHTESFGEEIAVYAPGAPLSNIVGIGDDVKEGTIVLEKNLKLKTQHVGVLASLGKGSVAVYKKPKVAILSTGDELVDINAPLKLGEIRDVNSHVLQVLLEKAGCEVCHIERVKDNFDLIKNTLSNCVYAYDIVLLSGGSSVGNHDNTPEIINTIGQPGVLVHGVAIKPGKPTIVAKARDKAIFGLPGHPASCVISFKAIVEPFIKEILLKTNEVNPPLMAKSGFKMHVSSGRDVFFMVKVDQGPEGLIVYPVQGKSGMVSLFSMADGYIVIPMEKEGIEVGEKVSLRMF